MPFPLSRPRRNRQTDWVRRMVRETMPTTDDLVWAMIVHDGDDAREPVSSMPGVERLNVREAAKAAKRAQKLGIPAIAIFPHINPAKKDEQGSEALNPSGLIPQCIKAMKDAAPDVGVICDVALDPFTTHGHDGLIDEAGYVLNDATTKVLVRQALMQAEAGADVLAPSDMMDGRVGAIRDTLEVADMHNVLICSYAAKYASAFYGPYRDAIGSSGALKGDKKTYQMDPGNGFEALREVRLDIEEGADMVMVKPGLAYLDIVHRVSSEFNVPTLAFQVSGEYAMIRAAGMNGWIDEDRAILETLMCFKRAGAAGLVTYFAERMAMALG
ncbi:MAG: porphobilinogen synthase [Hirschia sp.]|nr:porphobilinogen synthase [Hirschia sp.]MBF17123.1 porphobilinogen synthase [Hirschia sp.]|tara:strand:+ start:158 stop:1141 length:984 start_codon:yes stop_codon:yes gene_type:complete